MNNTKLRPQYEITVNPPDSGPWQLIGIHSVPGGIPPGVRIRLAGIKRKRRTK